MMVAEETIGQILSQLPDVVDSKGKSFEVLYNWGTEKILNKFISLPDTQSKYPLVWLVRVKSKHEVSKNTVQLDSTRLIIATRSDKVNEFNPFIYQTDFKTILNPVVENIIKAFERSGLSSFTKYEVERHPNYHQNQNKGVTVDIWNAITLDFTDLMLRNDRCINEIKF